MKETRIEKKSRYFHFFILETLLILILILSFTVTTNLLAADVESERALGSCIITPSSDDPKLNTAQRPTGNALQYLVDQDFFSNSEINLAQGALQFSETDIALPGKNGLDMVIGRKYSSYNYQAEMTEKPTEPKMWAGWAGHGWSFSFAMRAFLVHFAFTGGTGTGGKIVIDSGGNLETYKYDHAVDLGSNKYCYYYKATNPGNFNIVKLFLTLSNSDKIEFNYEKIVMQTTEGISYTFANDFFYEDHHGMHSDYYINHWIFKIKGFYLTSISDPQNNIIYINYEAIGLNFVEGISDNKNENFKMGFILGKKVYTDYAYDSPEDEYGFVRNTDAKYHYERLPKESGYIIKRPIKITDTFGRVIDISYNDSQRNMFSGYKETMITGIKYKNINNTINEIKYSYTANGNLATVQIDNLPKKEYDYYHLDKQFKIWRRFEKTDSTTIDRYYKTFLSEDNTSWQDEVVSVAHECPFVQDNLYKCKLDYRGFLLNAIYNTLNNNVCLGNSIQYKYNFVYQNEITSEKDFTVCGTDEGCLDDCRSSGNSYTDHTHYELVNPYQTYSKIVQKVVKQKHNDTEAICNNFSYPTNKVSYDLPNSNDKGYYFEYVKAKTTNSQGVTLVADQEYYFDHALPIKQTNGLMTTETVWDFVNNRQENVIIKKNGVIATQKNFYKYDNFNNAGEIHTKVADQEYLIQQNDYYTDTNFIANNLVHLLKIDMVIESSSLNSKNFYYEYYPNGKPKEIYEGTGPSGKKVKSYTYYADGRIDTETTYGLPSGNSVVHFDYFKLIKRGKYELNRI